MILTICAACFDTPISRIRLCFVSSACSISLFSNKDVMIFKNPNQAGLHIIEESTCLPAQQRRFFHRSLKLLEIVLNGRPADAAAVIRFPLKMSSYFFSIHRLLLLINEKWSAHLLLYMDNKRPAIPFVHVMITGSKHGRALDTRRTRLLPCLFFTSSKFVS